MAEPPVDPNTQAIALEQAQDAAEAATMPTVVAKGKGAIAEKILELAFAHDVKVRQDQDLVEMLQHLEIESEIPVEAWAAVGEILRRVYLINNGEYEAGNAPAGDSQ